MDERLRTIRTNWEEHAPHAAPNRSAVVVAALIAGNKDRIEVLRETRSAGFEEHLEAAVDVRHTNGANECNIEFQFVTLILSDIAPAAPHIFLNRRKNTDSHFR